MTGLLKSLERLFEDANWFADATELRAHLVLANPDMMEQVLRVILRCPRITKLPTPYLTFAEPFAGADAGWAARIAIVDEARALLVEELALRGTTIATATHAAPGRGDFNAFAVSVVDLAAATRGVCGPPVVVFAPEAIELSERWAQEMALLLGHAGLASVRTVLVLPDDGSVKAPIAALDTLALVTDCRSNPSDLQAFIAKLVANAESAPTSGAPLAVLGMAWPKVSPPPRRDLEGNLVPTHTPTAEDQARLSTRLELMRAALTLSSRNGPATIQHMRAAVDSLNSVGLTRDALTLRFVMATTVASFGEPKLACRELDAVKVEATRLEQPLIAAQASSAKAALLIAGGQTKGALDAYGEAVTSARAAGPEAVPFLIEILRSAGQLCLETRQDDLAVSCFRDALAVAEAAPPAAGAGGAEVARSLAKAFRKRGLHDQATSLEAQAERLEQAALSEPAEDLAP